MEELFITPMRKTYAQWKACGRNVRQGEHGRYDAVEDAIVFEYMQTRLIKSWSERKGSMKTIDYDTLPNLDDYETLSLLFGKRGVSINPYDIEENKSKIRVWKSWYNAGRLPIPKKAGLKVKRKKHSVSTSGALVETWERVSVWHYEETLSKDAYVKKYGQKKWDSNKH
jgi:hypothetical protein